MARFVSYSIHDIDLHKVDPWVDLILSPGSFPSLYKKTCFEALVTCPTSYP